jgi:D-alanyl-D-alanine carboxypeptidase (penicillin-binding protein 5/6)
VTGVRFPQRRHRQVDAPNRTPHPCALSFFIPNFPRMNSWRTWLLSICALFICFTGFAQDEDQAVRPTGISKAPAREQSSDAGDAKPKSKKARRADRNDDADDEEASATKPPRKRKASARAAHNTDDGAALGRETNGAPRTSAKSIIMIDARTGQILYEKNPDEFRPAASTQKLLTALIVAEHGFLDKTVTVESIDTLAEPVKLNIRAGETYQRIDLLRALLVKSPNDVARCLARDNAGSIEAFAAVMNEKARELGASHSHFVNPNGLPVPGQYSTARDLSVIAKAAYANPTIRSIVCMPHLVFRYSNGRTRELENTNKLLLRLPYCNGMKTGYTEAAGKCLIASGARPGKDVIVVVLGDSSGTVWRDAGALLQWGLWNTAG